MFASCLLATVSLLNKPRFNAFSYVWGDASATETILLDVIPWQVTRNLAITLNYLAQPCAAVLTGPTDPSQGRDASIGRCNLYQVKGHREGRQVSLMGGIYSSATPVYSWLGTDPCISVALKTLY